MSQIKYYDSHYCCLVLFLRQNLFDAFEIRIFPRKSRKNCFQGAGLLFVCFLLFSCGKISIQACHRLISWGRSLHLFLR